MAHIGQKFAFRAGGFFGPFFGRFQFTNQRRQPFRVFLLRLPGGFQVLRILLQFIFGAAALDKLSDLAADGVEQIE